MAYNNGIDGKALLDEISKVIDAAANQYHEAGEDAGEEYVKGVVDGIKKHSKDAKSEIAKLYEDFNKTTNNFKSRKSVTQAEWTRVLGLSKELMKSEHYADSVREKLSDISVTLKNGTKVSGLEKVLEEWSKVGGLVESVSWADAGKNYRKKPSTKKPKVIDTTETKVDPAPVVKAEEKKQDAIKDTTAALRKQEKANVDINKTYDAVKYRANYEDEYKDILKNGKEISAVLTEQRKSLMQQLQPVRETATRISEAASIKNIPFDSLYQEAANVGQQLSTMYDEGITDTEEYVSLQYKLINILDSVADSAGGVKGSGAKSMAQLRNWIFNSIAQDTGVDIGTSDVVDAIWGQGKFSIYGSDGKKRNIREIAAELVGYKGTSFTGGFGAEEDYNQLTKINSILKFIKENAQSSGEQFEAQQDNIRQEIDLIDKKTDVQKEFNKSKQEENILYHAGDLSNPSKTQKTYPLGHVRPSRSGGIFNGFTGLYTTEDIDGFWGNEWSGAPISTIDASQYKLFDARTDELATKAKEFFNSLNGTIYGYIEDFSTGEIKKITDVKSIDELWVNFKEVFKNTNMTFEKFSDFVKKAQSLVSGKNFDFVDGLPDLDEGIVKAGEKSALQGVSKEVFNSDSFQTQLLKMLGFEGIDLRGTKHNGTYTGGTVIFDVKPESIKTTNEKWSDVMASHGYEIDEADLVREEKRRQLAFDTAKAYSQQADVAQKINVNTGESKPEEQAYEQLVIEQQITAEKQKQNELVAIHGTSTENLIHALKEGAFPSPSIALTKPDVYSGGYGDSTVVFKKSAIDPKNNPDNKIYGVDAYTPTYPSFGYELNEQALVKASEQTGIAIDSLRYACDGAYETIESAVKTLGVSAGIGDELKEAFIKERGFTIKASEIDEPTQERFHAYDEEIHNGVRDIIAQDGITFDSIINDDEIQRVYFEAVDQYVNSYNSQFENFPQAKIKEAAVEAFKERVKEARTNEAIYNEDKAIFEHDQAVIRGQLKTVDRSARFNELQRIISENIADYNEYVAQVLKSFMVKPNVRGANGQRFDRTPDGIAAAMATFGGKNALYNEDPFMRRSMDDQLFIIGAAKNYKSIEEAEADVSRLQKDAAGTHTKLDNGYIQGIVRAIAKANNIEDQAAFDKIAQAVDGNTTAEAIGKALKNSGLIVDDAMINKLAVAAQEAANVNTRYFEAKPQRALGLEDIAFVSLPQDSANSSSIKEMLKASGIPFVDHKSDDSSREKALLEGMRKFDIAGSNLVKQKYEENTDDFEETFDVIQKGEQVTAKFVTTANTVHEALRKMRDALPEDKQEWGEYIDNILAQDDDKMIGAFKSISGSMGDHSELYKMENLGDGRIAVTFAGIREEIEATTDTAEQSKKSLQDVLELIDKMSSESGDSDAFNKRHKVLIDKANNLTSGVDYDQLYSQLIENENKYQQELEEANRINKEREGQLDAYAQAAGAFLGDSKYDGVSFDDKNKLFENFGNKIMQDGLSASDAMDQLYLSMEKLIQQSKEMPDDVIESFGAENEHVAETVSQLQKLSSIDLTRIFDSIDLKSFLQAFNIDQSNFAAFRKLFEELMQITNAMANGVDVGNAFNSKMDEITNTIMRLGGNMVDLDDAGYATMMQDFYKHMSNTKVQFNDTIKADYTKDQWKSLYGTYKNRLTADLTKGIGSDSLYHELSGLFPSLFPEGVLSQQDQFKLIFDKLDEARQLQANNWKTLQGFVSSDRDDIQIGVDNMFNQMSEALYADSSASELNKEANAFKEVEQSATKAANAKGKFSKKNKELGDGAAESSDDLDDEAESLENVNRAAANMPDVSAYDSTTVRYDTNGNPYSVSGTSRQEMIDGTHVRSTDNYQFDAENNRWDYMGTVQSSERTREMVQALEEYYRILNQIQKLRLDPSNAIHTEEINKLETDDLARAYQRVCDLGIQVNDIEGQINLSVNQRRALLDVELRARQEMYDVIAKMEDKQATAATKPFQKTVADEIKKAANIDTNVRLLGDDGVSDRLQSQIADYRRLVDELVEMRLQLARNSDLTNDVDFSNRFADTAKRAQNARVAIEGVFKESQKLQKLGTLIATDSNDVSRLENLKTAMIEFANSALDGEVKINGFNKEGTEMYVTLNQGADAVQNITVALDRATGHLQAFSTGTSKATNEWEDFKAKAVDGAKNIIGMYVGFQEGVQAIRTGANYVKEIDLAMTELKKVTDETDASYKQFLEDAGSTSAIIGSTIRDFTEASATFARLGYSLEESSSMAETAIIYKNVADGLDTVEESSESIISTMMAFGIEANDTMSIIDRFNAVGKLYADYKVA